MGDLINDPRSYTHKRCGESTALSGVYLLALCDPFSATVGTYCSDCEDHFPLKQFTWDDTGEGISSTRRRHAAESSFWVRFLMGSFWIIFPLSGAALGFGAGFAFGRVVGAFSWPLGIAGGLAGVVAGVLVLGALIPVLLKNSFGVSDWRELR